MFIEANKPVHETTREATSQTRAVQLEASWKELLADEFAQPYMVSLRAFLAAEYSAGKTIYPAGKDYITALNLTPFKAVKTVILGQDPYHGPGQAHGLAFSVRPGVPPPPSLVNMYKELRSDLGTQPPAHGYLGAWAERGVLLLNSVLTVEQGLAGSHAHKGWETFTDRIMALLSAQRNGIAFVLWGAYAQKKGQIIDRDRHLVLTSVHPSPLSAHRGFLGSRPYSKINTYLVEQGQAPIDWQLPALPAVGAAAAATAVKVKASPSASASSLAT